MTPSRSSYAPPRRHWARMLVAALALAATGHHLWSAAGVRAQDAPVSSISSVTGYGIEHQPFGEYYAAHGGPPAFGPPVSRTIALLGCKAQLFQRHVLQQCGAGPVQPMNLLDPGVMPVTRVNGSAFPAHDPVVAGAAPPPATPEYGRAVLAHVLDTVPDTFGSLPVGFRRAYLETAAAGDPEAAALHSLELWGFPTSRPAADPANGGFVYQRFQRGIMHYDAATGATTGILLGDWLKAVLTGTALPPDLEASLGGSRFLRQYCPGGPGSLCRPDVLPATDLTRAFEPATAPPPPTPTPTPTPAGSDPGAGVAVEAAAAAATQAGYAPALIRVVRVEARDWPDTSLGCPQPGYFYAQVITPGYLVLLDAGGTTLEYHTDRRGRAVLCPARA